jgi:hypothetical protein
MSAVQARVHYAMKQEFHLLKEIIRDYAPPEYSYEPEEGGRGVKQSDYDMVDVIPVSDPNAATMAQKVVQYQAALQLAQTAPQLYDLPQLHRQMLEVIGIKNYQKLVPLAEDMKPRDPITENMNMLNGKPVKAFIGQDHGAHITVHMSMTQDPHIMMLVSQDPQLAQRLQAANMAHVAEHLGMAYRQEMEKMMGQTLPPYKEEADEQMMAPDMEVKVAQMAAQAATQLLNMHKQEAQQQQNQQAAQDPLIQLQQQELQLKGQDLQRKAQKDQSDAALKAQQIQVERERIQAQQEAEGAKAALKAKADQAQRNHAQEQQGFNSAIDLHKHQMQLSHQAQMSQYQAQQKAQKPTKKGE